MEHHRKWKKIISKKKSIEKEQMLTVLNKSNAFSIISGNILIYDLINLLLSCISNKTPMIRHVCLLVFAQLSKIFIDIVRRRPMSCNLASLNTM